MSSDNKHIIETSEIIRQEEIGIDIYSMWLKTEMAKTAVPGQFISVYTNDGTAILPRPISICEINEEKTALRIVYRVVGKGTKEFSTMFSNEYLKIMGPLGNGYTMKDKTAIVCAGGIGVPPMLELTKQLTKKFGCKVNVVLGYRDELFLVEEFEKYAKVYISTEDGSAGTKGNIIDAIKANNISADIIYSCGPMPMLRAVKQYAKDNNMEAQISLEERMACGIGACLGCVCKTNKKDHHTHVNNTRICTDGPVFDANDVEI